MPPCDKLDGLNSLNNSFCNILVRWLHRSWSLSACHQTILAFYQAKQRSFCKDSSTIDSQERVGDGYTFFLLRTLSPLWIGLCLHFWYPLSLRLTGKPVK